jgi:glutathione S-transferase
MIVYGSSLSPFVRKVLVFAAEKAIPVELKPNAGPAGVDADFLACSPFRKIPAARDGDFEICDSSAIVAYMDRLQPQPELVPADPRSGARVVWYEEFADTILAPAVIGMFFNRVVAPLLGRPQDLAAADRAETELLPPALDYLEKVAPAPGRFLVGERLTLADIAVGSLFVNLMHLDMDVRSSHPGTAAYAGGVLERPSFRALIEGEKAFLAARAPQPA